uniref:ATP-dependent DNA helicase n=1 Tax=Dicentrarchus labrax TaxID=13489 RepID=A0A8P4K4J2_DICLA
MPRGKGYRRSQAAKRRWAGERPLDVDFLPPSPEFVPRRGTGKRRRVKEWDRSVSGKQHKLVVPAHSPEKKFVLLVGDSHLRPFADGTVGLSKGNLSFGIMSTPGASACHLRAELIHAVLPRTPDAVCILAPGNNLTTSSTHEVAGEEFRELLLSACQRCANVFVVDFVPRLTVAPELQEHMSREFHSVAQKMGIAYYSTFEHFPFSQLDLWVRDSVHLSDDDGMEILSKVLWDAAYKQLEVPAPKAKEAPRTPSPVPRTPPRLLVKEEVFAAPPSSPPPDPYVWMEMVKGKKRIQSEEQLCSPSKRRVVRHQVGGCPIVLKECFIPLNPVLFSTSMLAAMDAVVPAQLPSPDSPAVPQDATTPSVEPRVKRVACKRRLAMCQVKASPSVEEASPRPTSANVVVGKEEVDATPSAVTVSSEPSSTTAVEEVATEEGDATPGAVTVSSEPSSTTAVEEVVEEEVSRSGPPIQRPSRFIKSKVDASPPSCRCAEKKHVAVVSGTNVRVAPTTEDVSGTNVMVAPSTTDVSIACSVVAALKHVIAPVCTWRGRDIDEICFEGKKLASFVAQSNGSSGFDNELCEFIKQHSVFGRKCNVAIGSTVYRGFQLDESVLHEKLQEPLLTDGMCLLNLHGAVSAVIEHNGYFVVVDCGTCDASGLASNIGRSVAVLNTTLRDLIVHIQDLKKSLGAEWCLISRLSVKADSDIDSATLLTDVAVDVTVATAAVVEGGSSQSSASSVRGSFHQADSRFQHAGVQCMAISLVAVAKHSIESVFSWQAGNLDKVVVLGDNLYNTLRDSNVTSEVSKLLSVPDLPKQAVIDGQTFDFEYEDCVSGFVNEVTSDLIEAGVTISLRSGLEKMFSKYDTCFLTLGGNTCAVISQGGRFAVVDSHARSADGMVDGEGKSVVVRFTCLDDVFEHMCKYATAFKHPKQFEIASVCVTPRCPVPSVNSLSSPKVLVESRGSQSGCGLPVQPTVGCTSIKRKRSSSGFSSKKAKNSDYAAVDSDVVFVADVVSEGLQFNPLCGVVVDTLCKQLNVESEKVDLVSTEVGPLGAPCLKEKIVGDGNCFFRAVSQAVCGTQKHHRKIRLAVVKHLKANGGALRPEYSSTEEYLTMSKMAYVGSWATEVEIQAAADFFGVSIFTYCDGRWLEYSCKSRLLSNQGIYLENCNGNHYESVVCVQQPNMQCCYGYCKVGGSRYNFRKQGVVCADNLISVASSICEAEVGIIDQNAQSIRKLSLSNYLVKKKNLQKRIKYQQNRQEFLEKMKMNYQGENGYKEKLNEMSKAKYRKNKSHRDTVKEMSKTKYRKNKSHRDTVKEMSKTKYRKNKSHSTGMSKTKYRKNKSHRDTVKEMSKTKYRKNKSHRDTVKEMSKTKYRKNKSHRDTVKEMSKTKYRKNRLHRQYMKSRSIKKYHGNRQHRQRVVAYMKLKRQRLNAKLTEFDLVMQQFLAKVNDGPDFVCCVCFRKLFRKQVLPCSMKDYSKRKEISVIAGKCISEQYLHKCSTDCVLPCQWLNSARGQLWICFSCNTKISRGHMPPECALNNLATCFIPPELACLNSLEQHLIALHIPFMKMLALPKGGQNGVHGPVTCVPANIVQTSNLLPRSDMDGSLLPVKLKRKLTYKGHYEYQFVDSLRIKQALQYLKQNNVHYKDVDFNEEWLNEFCREQESVAEQDSAAVDGNANDDSNAAAEEDELLHDRQQHCMFQDTCLMPVDIGQEALDQYFDNILNVAPAEGNTPVKLLSDHSNEAKCFPVLFPTGSATYHDSRPHRLTLCRYFNNRILNADGRFAQNVDYIFFAQYMSEVQQVVSSVSIALRKGKGGQFKNVTTSVLNDEEQFKQLLQFDDGYRFLKPIRGTPSFWQGVQRDLLACVRQLGIPTWFCSFSSADMRWKNLLNSILKQEGRTETAEELEWADRCELLRRNPVTAARMFDFRWHCFLKEVLMSPSNPIGKVIDYFYRVEFQQRGSPHVHCLFWIENAPIIDKNTDEEVIQFIDNYVTCELPAQDETLLDIVSSVQKHSKRHSKTCKKNRTVCRFNFPKPPSARTFISRPPIEDEEEDKTCTCQKDGAQKLEDCACKIRKQKKLEQKAMAVNITTKIKMALSDDNVSFDTVEQLFHYVQVDQRMFEKAYNICAKKTHVVLRRQANEVWINQYSKPLLKCWNANIDIQYVVDAYACVVYIISYISKAEREIGLLLGNAQREAAREGNSSAKDALKNLGSVYLHNRDVCAQEAVYRLTSMHLKECSRQVVFVPVGDHAVKMSLPLSMLKQKALSHDLTTEDMWMTSSVDRYKNRPRDDTFNDMCMATFASEYRVLSKSQMSVNRIVLDNNCGFILKRTRSDPAVIRYAHFSETKNPELFYQSIMQLFLPFRIDMHLKPAGFETFEQFYSHGHVGLNDGVLHSVKSVVDSNRSRFEIDAEKLDNIHNLVDTDAVLEDAWCDLCPEQEQERLECLEERRKSEQPSDEPVEGIPDLATSNREVSHLEKRQNVLCRSDGLALIRSLNDTQLSIFYQIRQWCLSKVNGEKIAPLRVFVTGGAGTGKSHLIKAIQYEAMRLLSRGCRNPDDICVLLTAPTGIAAHNLHAGTIHSSFGIGKDVRLPYTPLGEEKLNSLRAKYSNLQLLIIDEISMVDHKLLAYIHGRLRQIKQSGGYSPFGNVSIIAVGDFYQLPPVKGKALYLDDISVGLWTEFQVAELKTVVRQKMLSLQSC